MTTEARKHQPFEYDPLDDDPRQKELCRLNGIIRSQNDALAHWRREADRDHGRITRMNNALFRIAHGGDDLTAVRELAKEALL